MTGRGRVYILCAFPTGGVIGRLGVKEKKGFGVTDVISAVGKKRGGSPTLRKEINKLQPQKGEVKGIAQRGRGRRRDVWSWATCPHFLILKRPSRIERKKRCKPVHNKDLQRKKSRISLMLTVGKKGHSRHWYRGGGGKPT